MSRTIPNKTIIRRGRRGEGKNNVRVRRLPTPLVCALAMLTVNLVFVALAYLSLPPHDGRRRRSRDGGAAARAEEKEKEEEEENGAAAGATPPRTKRGGSALAGNETTRTLLALAVGALAGSLLARILARRC